MKFRPRLSPSTSSSDPRGQYSGSVQLFRALRSYIVRLAAAFSRGNRSGTERRDDGPDSVRTWARTRQGIAPRSASSQPRARPDIRSSRRPAQLCRRSSGAGFARRRFAAPRPVGIGTHHRRADRRQGLEVAGGAAAASGAPGPRRSFASQDWVQPCRQSLASLQFSRASDPQPHLSRLKAKAVITYN